MENKREWLELESSLHCLGGGVNNIKWLNDLDGHSGVKGRSDVRSCLLASNWINNPLATLSICS
jgi:hypothetical protein